MAALTPKDQQYFNQQLRERRAALCGDIADGLIQSQREDFAEIAGRVHDAGEESVAELVMSTNFSALDREARELREVEAAIIRLRAGRYGKCVECGGDIDRERLLVNPTARRCIRCQARREQTYGGRDATPSF